MTAGTLRKKVGRGYERDLDAGPFRPMTDSFDLHLRAERKSPKTIRIYVDAVLWFAAAYLIPAGLSDWSEVKARHVQQWVTTLLADPGPDSRPLAAAGADHATTVQAGDAAKRPRLGQGIASAARVSSNAPTGAADVVLRAPGGSAR